MERPEHVDIFSKRYTITYCDRPSDVDHDGRDSLWGQMDHWKHSIRVYAPDGFSRGEIWDSIIHEVLHAVAYELRLEMKGDDNAIGLLALGIADVFYRNGWLREEFA